MANNLDCKQNDILIKNNDYKLCIILCTTPNEDIARDIAQHLLVNKLAACITLLPNVTSLYYWEGSFKQQHEMQLLIKSHMILKQEIFAQIKNYHPYQTAELLVLPIIDGDHDYLSWINDSLK